MNMATEDELNTTTEIPPVRDVDDIQLHVTTPLIFSAPLSSFLKRPVYLKLENTQPSGSFKLRGIGHSCRLAVKAGATHLICSSGGNAGMATAYSAKLLGVKASVFTMDGLPQTVLKKFSDLGCELYMGGSIWDTCDASARKYMAKLEKEGEKTHYIHPFDSPAVWDGHSTLVHEMHGQLSRAGYNKPGAVVTCVGGGGLLAGVARGMLSIEWGNTVPIVAMETYGAESFNKALDAGKPVKLTSITSVAKTLGALQVCDEVVNLSKKMRIISKVIDDETAVRCCNLFLRDHQFLVEPACGATLSPLYTGKINEYLEEISSTTPIVVIVCGGATVDSHTLQTLTKKFEIDTTLDRVYHLQEMIL